MNKKSKSQPKREEPRNAWLKFRVNEEEREHVEALANNDGVRMTDYLRSLVGLPALKAGAPKGNRNRAKKNGVP